MTSITTDSLQAEIYSEDEKFQRACYQVIVLTNVVLELQTRYDRAVEVNLRTARYYLRLRLTTVEGIRNMFYEYASVLADKIDSLEIRMRNLGVEPAIIYPMASFLQSQDDMQH